MFYIYAHFTPGSMDPFYVGKGKDGRAWSKQGRNNHWKGVVRKYGYEVQFLENKLDEETAFDLECHYIACFGRLDLHTGCLVNQTDGGEGQSGRKVDKITRSKIAKKLRGYKHSIETRNLMSVSHALNPSAGMLGKKHSLETLERMSKIRKGRTSHRKGTSLSEDVKLKMRHAQLARWKVIKSCQ